jgi:hypothetical protein
MSTEYSSAITDIIQKLETRQPLPPLAPEKEWDGAIVKQIQSASLDELFDGQTVKDTEFGNAVKSGLLLWNDALDESHTISQQLNSKTGSYWHGIMHRREPDYSNSKYWFGRVGNHSVFPALRKRALDILADSNLPDYLEAIQEEENWDAYQFVDWCQAEAENGREQAIGFLQKVQIEEIKLLLDYSYRHTLG